jgi:hypothetical protein
MIDEYKVKLGDVYKIGYNKKIIVTEHNWFSINYKQLERLPLDNLVLMSFGFKQSLDLLTYILNDFEIITNEFRFKDLNYQKINNIYYNNGFEFKVINQFFYKNELMSPVIFADELQSIYFMLTKKKLKYKL